MAVNIRKQEGLLTCNLANIENSDEVKYINKLATHKQFIILHLAKLFYYWNHSAKDNLFNPEWTKNHWISEITSLFRFTDSYNYKNPDKEIKLNVDKLDSKYDDRLLNALSINSEFESYMDIWNKFINGKDESDIHVLPKLNLRYIRSNWNKFYIFYNTFIRLTLDRIRYSKNELNNNSIYNFIDIAVNKKYKTSLELSSYTRDIRFSEYSLEEKIDWIKSNL